MTRLLLDANLSPSTAAFLGQTFGFDVADLITLGKAGLRDHEVVDLAKRDHRVVITFDRDFGEIYHLRERGNLGVVVMRLQDQTGESVNRLLERFFRSEAKTIDLEHSLVILDERRMRIVH